MNGERIKALLAKLPPMSPEQEEEQRRSFVYGNCAIENELVTREMVDEVAERMARDLLQPPKDAPSFHREERMRGGGQ